METQRHRLLHAAAEVFAKGFGRASVAAIVKRAGMSRRTFYEHFDDLTDALIELYDASAKLMLCSVEAAYRSASTPRDRLQAALEAYLTIIAANANLARIIYAEIHAAGPNPARRHEATIARFAKLLSEWAEGARSARVITRLPDDFTLFATLFGVEGAAMRFVYHGDERRLAAATPRFVEFVIAAFR